MTTLMPLADGLMNWLIHGLLDANWWQIVVYTLVTTHLTIASVTIFLHRSQAHRSVDLHAIPSHFFRLWLWLGTGQVTKEWVATHRKHHAKCETAQDPHSPQVYGIKKLLLEGAELYRIETKNLETLEKYGHGTPDDWLERKIYGLNRWYGVGLMMVIDLALFGVAGLTVWAVQMIWIPVTAAGIINGLGHWWGYRNFEAPDASTNISPWGIIIGGEELHNNHHTYPTSAKLSVKPYEFDLGWVYIRGLEMMGLARVRKTVPVLRLGDIKPVADSKTLEAVIANRYEVMANYAKHLRDECRTELMRLKAQGEQNTARWKDLHLAQRWLHRDEDKIPHALRDRMARVCDQHAVLAKLVAMREELRSLWTRTNVSADQLVLDLQAWCRKAEESGIADLQSFAIRLRASHA